MSILAPSCSHFLTEHSHFWREPGQAQLSPTDPCWAHGPIQPKLALEKAKNEPCLKGSPGGKGPQPSAQGGHKVSPALLNPLYQVDKCLGDKSRAGTGQGLGTQSPQFPPPQESVSRQHVTHYPSLSCSGSREKCGTALSS